MPSINIHLDPIIPRVSVLQIPDGRAFFVIYLGDVAMHGQLFNEQASAYAKTFADELQAAAARIEDLMPKPAPVEATS